MAEDLIYKEFLYNRAFGIEIEMNPNKTQNFIAEVVKKLDNKHNIKITNYAKSNYVSSWHVKFDRTCGYTNSSGGWELTSYKGKNRQDLHKFGLVAQALNLEGIVINDNCGFHIHVEVKDLTKENIATIVAYWMKMENVIKHIVPASRVNNVFCQFLKSFYDIKKINECKTSLEFWKLIKMKAPYTNVHRRLALNLVNLYEAIDKNTTKRRTLELRLPECSLHYYNVVNWVRFFLTFIETTSKMPFPKDLNDITLDESFSLIGVRDINKDAYILDSDLYATLNWFLKRVSLYGTNEDVKYRAKTYLSMI